MIQTEEKVWGKARHIFSSPSCAVSVLEVNEGFRCSRHYHRHRVNRFVVQSGEINVVTPYGANNLKPGEVFDVPAGMLHWFEVVKSGIVVEIYWAPPVELGDIVRSDLGGKL